MPATIVWNAAPELFQIGSFTLRWYNLLFAAAFILALPIWHYMFTKAGKDIAQAERLKVYLIFGVILGARLGHVIFYEWNYYKHHLLQIFLPVIFSPQFKIVGFAGLASHGAAIGILLSVFLFVKQIKITLFPPRIYFKNSQSSGMFLWTLDHLVILVALAGIFIRIGNFMNSEIIGKPTGRNYGVVFVRSLHNKLSKRHASMIENLSIHKAAEAHTNLIKGNYQPLQLTISFKSTIKDEMVIKDFLQGSFKDSLVRESYCNEGEPTLYEVYGTPLSYSILQEQNGSYQAIVYTLGIPRHPAQLYESASCLLIFIALLWWWYKKGQVLAPGRILGAFLIAIFALRFFYEFYKENQVAFENTMWLNMGQLLSLPLILVGLFFILRPAPKTI